MFPDNRQVSNVRVFQYNGPEVTLVDPNTGPTNGGALFSPSYICACHDCKLLIGGNAHVACSFALSCAGLTLIIEGSNFGQSGTVEIGGADCPVSFYR